MGGKITISGSLAGERELVIGPNAAPGTVNSPSASLKENDLQFNRDNTAYIGNFNTSGTSKLALSAGGGGSSAFTNIELSASGDTVQYNGLAEFKSSQIGTNELSHT